MQDNHTLFETLFNRNMSDPENHEFLRSLVEEHPYFSPAQFFLLQQTEKGNGSFEKQAVKTNILFNNPYWLNFQLKQTGQKVEGIEELPQAEKVQEAGLKTDEPVLVQAGDLPDNTDETDAMETEIEPMKIELKMPVESGNLNEAMLFEPMHVVDYFASQGIKLTDEVQTADKLGKQLKSFTEWLKTMKKVHVENEAENTGVTDGNIQIMAEKSNTDTGVLTESMAEVFVKQGKLGKASEVYEKLSLLNPAKSTYFAAKIENLKGI